MRIQYNIEMKAELDYVIYMSVCTLLAPFQKYLVISVVFGLSICTATTDTSTVGNRIFVIGFFGVGVGRISNNKIGLRVMAQKVKICSYLHVGKNRYTHDVF